MGQEIELKLSIHHGDIGKFVHHPLIALFSDGPAVEKRLVNQYFDTPEQSLRTHAMALRIRSDGGTYIQTLKQKGKSLDGLTVRGEWEWPVDGFHVRADLIPKDILPPEIRRRMNCLAPVFRTDFHRTLWTLRVPRDNEFELGGPLVAEMVLDRGEVLPGAERGGAREEILEVELELLEGEPDTLYRISDLLKKTLRVAPSDISKAQRGYRLVNDT